MLINISGIGPKGALAILGVASLQTLRKAIGTGDISYLTKISGIGKKTAEKIVIELRDKMEKAAGETDGGLHARRTRCARGAPVARLLAKRISRGAEKVDADLDTNKKIKEALKILATK